MPVRLCNGYKLFIEVNVSRRLSCNFDFKRRLAKFNVYFYCKKSPLTTKRKRNWPQKVFTAHFRLHYYNDYDIIMINRRKLQLLLDSYRRCFFSDLQSWFYTFCISWHWPVILSCLTETARNRIESTYQEENIRSLAANNISFQCFQS